MKPIAVISGSRTPFCKAFTSLTNFSAVELGVHAVTSAVNSASLQNPGFSIRDVDEVILGNVAGPPDAANMARVVALRCGHPTDAIAHTVNRNCASGMESLIAGWMAIETGRAKHVLAGGAESMSSIPMLFRSSAAKRFMALARSKTMWQKMAAIASFRPKHFRPRVGIQLGLTDPVSGMNMGETAEVLASEFSISREDQDAYALMSHERGSAARERCFLSGEITPIESVNETNACIARDNGPRDNQSLEQLARLRPLFGKSNRTLSENGVVGDRQPATVTAGNSCPLTDGAAALLLASSDSCPAFAAPLGYITAYAVAGCEPHRMGLGPVYATAKLLRQTGLTIDDFDLIELNEAFAAQVLACQAAAGSREFCQRELGLSGPMGAFPMERTNVHGGAIALGHPVGSTGTRMVLTLLRALRERGARRGLATLCVGGGQGVAMMVQTELER